MAVGLITGNPVRIEICHSRKSIPTTPQRPGPPAQFSIWMAWVLFQTTWTAGGTSVAPGLHRPRHVGNPCTAPYAQYFAEVKSALGGAPEVQGDDPGGDQEGHAPALLHPPVLAGQTWARGVVLGLAQRQPEAGLDVRQEKAKWETYALGCIVTSTSPIPGSQSFQEEGSTCG